ncbi:major facilitator superfamily transporter [Rhizoctonia solani]|uniref:Major facilitator superfamily transporter n=1 Tax=Rhizoctonia solani TaxID=456999 RepID=A0A8H8SXD0_9AGAM|nr:major facilitator superfamily transporter [Rhizoctonia solani]QRW21254.1 major facilitator superfamily transporter [Rhizoctonia solani]
MGPIEKEQTRSTENQSPKSISSESPLKSTSTAWSNDEESQLVRKLDWRILPVVTVLYLANFRLEKDIGLVGYQYNIGLSLFYITYALSEVPSNLLLKRVGADIWIPILVIGFGLVCFSTAFIKNFASASTLSGAFGGLLASGLLKIPRLKGLPSGAWRNIFLVEGAITIALGLAGFYFLPGSIEKNKFLDEREKMIAVRRLMEDEDNGNTAGSQAVQGDSWWRAFKDLNTLICGQVCFLFDNIVVQGISLFMPTLMKNMGYSTIQSQLRTVPPYVVASVFAITVAYGSFRSGRRGIWLLFFAPLVISGLAILLGTANPRANYAAMFLIAMGAFPQGPMLLSWATNNSAPNTVRAVSSALVVAIGTIGPIITSWIYLPGDSPRYRIANSVQLGGQVTFFALVAILMVHNMRENRRRARGERDYRLDASEQDIARLGSLHPNFRLIV